MIRENSKSEALNPEPEISLGSGLNSKQIQMTKTQNSKQYDLEDRILEFARRVGALIKKLPKTIGNIEDGKQVIRSSGLVGANFS